MITPGPHLVIFLPNPLLFVVQLDYRVNRRLKFRLASKRGDLGDKEILQQFTALLLDEFTCSCSRSTYKARDDCKSEKRERAKSKTRRVTVFSSTVVRTRGYDVVDDHDRLSRRDRVRLHFKLVLLQRSATTQFKSFTATQRNAAYQQPKKKKKKRGNTLVPCRTPSRM